MHSNEDHVCRSGMWSTAHSTTPLYKANGTCASKNTAKLPHRH